MKRVKRLYPLVMFVFLGSSLPLANVLAEQITQIPKGTVFKLRHELEIPANQDFLMLGKSVLHEVFNNIEQYYNINEGRYYYNNNRYYPYFRYDHFEQLIYKNYWSTYNNCLERHRQYWQYSTPATDNVIVNQGNGNTNIIINNSTASSYSSGSYIGNNQCIAPSFTYSFLVIDKNEADGGGIFRDGYEFKVKRVKVRHFQNYSRISILFDHDIARGVVVISTKPVNSLYASQLVYNSGGSGDGFWAGLGTALGNMNSIAGSYFDVYIPDKQYYD